MILSETPAFQKRMIHKLFGNIQQGGLRVQYWDEEEADYGCSTPQVKLIFKQCPSSLLNVDDPASALGQAYMDGVLDYEGRLEDLLLLLSANQPFFAKKKAVTQALQSVRRIIDRTDAKKNIQYHYDLGNDFFGLWLDETLSYSCAYFKNRNDSLQQAQLQKIEHVLKKLNLQPGETLLDIGSGWGWLIMKAAQTYHVKATGITLSEEQFRATQERIMANDLSNQVDVKLISYLNLDETKYQFDKIVSVGMFEHVGKENIPKYLDKVKRLLVDGGLSLLHTITGTSEDTVGSNWMQTHIFPGGYVPSLREIVWQLPDYNLNLLHSESLRRHYAMTLDHWYKNFSENVEVIKDKFGDRFVRMWELYLKGCAASFRTAQLDIYQILFTKGINNELPLTFDHFYI